ncbi:MAG: GGDEF domain-containing protein, partial [Candidatus Deferrimicrobiaceae bacterium]
MTTGTGRKRLRSRPGDLFLLAILLANLACGAGLIGALRADLTEERIADESTLVSSKIDAFLWGKILQFASTVEEGRVVRKGAPAPGAVGPVTVVGDLPPEGNFQRVRSGSGEWLPVFIGTPRDLEKRGAVLPVGLLLNGVSPRERFILGTISLADLNGYLADLTRRGIHCRIVDAKGNILLVPEEGGSVRWGSVSRSGGKASVLGGALSREWSVQVYIPDVGSRLPFLPQAVLALFFLLNAGTLVFLRKRFILPIEAALAAVTETVAAHGNLLPESPGPRDVAGGVDSLLSRYRMEAEAEKRAIGESLEHRIRESANSQKSLLAHHRLTKKMLQSRQADEVFEILLGGIVEGYGFPGTLIGKVSDDGHLVFHGETDPVSGSSLRIPLWHPGSLLARTFWSGNLLQSAPLDLPHLPEEESILGSSPVFCIPVMRTLKVRCAEAKNCGDRSCPSYFSENLKCWTRHVPKEFYTPDANPEIFRDAVCGCLRCEVFPPSALLVVRSVPGGKTVTRENVVPLSNLASEASLALEVVSLYDSMKIMAVTDGLTGLYNHKEFYQAIRRELERARRYQHTLSLLMIDVDDFKQFNDRFGHPAGDVALRSVANLLRVCARTTDIIARYGGEEFAVILPESTPAGALMVAERIKSEVAGHNFIQNASIPVHLTVSIGIYSSDRGNVSED